MELDQLFRVEFRVLLMLLHETPEDGIPCCEHFETCLDGWRIVSTSREHADRGPRAVTKVVAYLCRDCAKKKLKEFISVV